MTSPHLASLQCLPVSQSLESQPLSLCEVLCRRYLRLQAVLLVQALGLRDLFPHRVVDLVAYQWKKKLELVHLVVAAQCRLAGRALERQGLERTHRRELVVCWCGLASTELWCPNEVVVASDRQRSVVRCATSDIDPALGCEMEHIDRHHVCSQCTSSIRLTPADLLPTSSGMSSVLELTENTPAETEMIPTDDGEAARIHLQLHCRVSWAKLATIWMQRSSAQFCLVDFPWPACAGDCDRNACSSI